MINPIQYLQPTQEYSSLGTNSTIRIVADLQYSRFTILPLKNNQMYSSTNTLADDNQDKKYFYPGHQLV